MKTLFSSHPDSSHPAYWVIGFLFFFIVITGRYLVISGLFYAIFYVWFPGKWKGRKLSQRAYRPGQLKKEIRWSTLSSIIFALAGILTLWLWQMGKTKIYNEVAAFGAWYLPFSLLLSMLFQETYYYWLHRLMHHPALFSMVHKIHHDSHTTSPFTAFSFHPIESVIQAVALPVILLLLPLHPIVILTQLILMTFTSVMNHLNIDIYPDTIAKYFIGKWIIGATHHSLHHKQYKYNFGLYFTIWDKLIKTESPIQEPSAEKLSEKIV